MDKFLLWVIDLCASNTKNNSPIRNKVLTSIIMICFRISSYWFKMKYFMFKNVLWIFWRNKDE